jgi:methylated-DNA-[protein]-cysteine S-methyltransferase
MPEETAGPAPNHVPPGLEPVRILTPSPLGVLGLEMTGELLTKLIIVPKGRLRKTFKPLGELKRKDRSDLLDETLGRLSEFLAGARRNPGLEYDLRSLGFVGFERRVFKETAKIPYGKTRSYQELAEAAGRPKSYRQIISILAGNPLPLAIPCHRVVTSRSGVGTYVAGTSKKTWLLKLEQRGLALMAE